MKAIILAAVVLSLATGKARAQSGSTVQAGRLAMGVAVSERYAVVWFGQVADTASRP